jgi:cyclopropane-fatty-acyl-phospholipid synthase
MTATAIDATAGIWPSIPAVRADSGRALVARALVGRMAARLPIRISWPDGALTGAGGPDAPRIALHDPATFYARVGGGVSGFAESYMAGEWDSEDLPGLFAVLAAHLPELVPAPLRALRRLYVPLQPKADDATVEGARRNIERHYDLSNEFFALFLDPTMTYSSALFAPGDDLERAQLRKIDQLLDLTAVGPRTRVLEIGTGWGQLASR